MNDLKNIFVYTGQGLPGTEFSDITIELDLSIRSNLKWNNQKKWASCCIEKGFNIVWDLNFGSLKEGEEGHFMALSLSIEHFINDILNPFREKTTGAILFKGKPDCDFNLLKMIHALFPENLLTFLLLETSLPKDLWLLSSLEFFCLAVTSQNMPYGLPTFGWGHCQSTLGAFTATARPLLPLKRLKEAFCLPLKPCEILFDRLSDCRIISEEALTTSWEGIDTIFVPYEKLSSQGKRKIAGFLAAGGTLVNIV